MASVGRNAPCPCGSGRKFKKCCGTAGVQVPSFDGTYFRFRVSLRHAEPEVWRRFLMRSDAMFYDLHRAVQACGWTDDHMWHFVDSAKGVIAGIPKGNMLFGEPEPDAHAVPLSAFFREEGASCVYVYDFGDGWEHEIVLEGIEKREEVFERALLDGSCHFPPEDCGGPPGFARLREFAATGVDPWGDEETATSLSDAWRGDHFDLVAERKCFGAAVPDAPAATRETEASRVPGRPRIQKLDGEVVSRIAKCAEEAAAEIGKELGLQIRLTNASYYAENAKIEIEVATVREDGVVVDKHAMDFLSRCEDFGLEPSDLGRVFTCDEKTFRVIGLRPRAKAPVVCEQLGARGHEDVRVRMSSALVRAHLRSEPRAQPEFRVLPRELSTDGEE